MVGIDYLLKINICFIGFIIIILYNNRAKSMYRIPFYKEFNRAAICLIVYDILEQLLNYESSIPKIIYDYLVGFYILAFALSYFLLYCYYYASINSGVASRRHIYSVVLIAPAIIRIIIPSIELIYLSRYYFIALISFLTLSIAKNLKKYNITNIFKYIIIPLLPLEIGFLNSTDFSAIPSSFGIILSLILYYIIGLKEIASLDYLTGLNNRNYLDKKLQQKMNYIRLKNGILYLFIVDIDNFKYINDNYGHLDGDNCLVMLSDILKDVCNNFDYRPYICRFGGDEFIIFSEFNDDNEAEQMKNSIEYDLKEKAKNLEYGFDISIGMKKYNNSTYTDANSLIRFADNELYIIKNKKKEK